MKKEKSPDRGEPIQGEINFQNQSKDSISLSKRQRKVYELLLTGKYSVADISIALHYSDPRSYIRELRKKGLNILDEWVENADTRHKQYWI